MRLSENGDQEKLDKEIKRMLSSVDGMFKNYNKPTDEKLFRELMEIYYNNIKGEFRPDFFDIVESKFDGDFDKYTEFVYGKSIFCDKQKLKDFLNKYKKIKSR